MGSPRSREGRVTAWDAAGLESSSARRAAGERGGTAARAGAAARWAEGGFASRETRCTSREARFTLGRLDLR